ncbi:MAG: hypothetical protein AAGD25_10300 [Cyanobacteria bacterium P01_F01_bin.150]
MTDVVSFCFSTAYSAEIAFTFILTSGYFCSIPGASNDRVSSKMWGTYSLLMHADEYIYSKSVSSQLIKTKKIPEFRKLKGFDIISGHYWICIDNGIFNIKNAPESFMNLYSKLGVNPYGRRRKLFHAVLVSIRHNCLGYERREACLLGLFPGLKDFGKSHPVVLCQDWVTVDEWTPHWWQ